MPCNIFVMGATGTVGHSAVEDLTKNNKINIRAASRMPQKAASLCNANVEWVEFDIERSETFDHALKGIDRVFMISRPGDEHADKFAMTNANAWQ